MCTLPKLLTKEDDGKHITSSFSIGLEVSRPLTGLCGQFNEPQPQRCERSNERECFEAFGARGARTTQRKAPAMVLEVAEHHFDLHAPTISSHDCCGVSTGVRQRGREQPGGSMELSIQAVVGAVALSLFRPTGASVVVAHEIETTPVSLALREAAPADVACARSGFEVEGIGIAPARRLGSKVLDLVSGASDSVPSVRFDLAKPRPAEARVGEDDGTNVPGQYFLEPAQEYPMRRRTVVSAYRMGLFVDGDGAPAYRRRSLDSE